MSVNKYEPHVFVIPEDRANEQVANGFVLHDQVKTRRIQVLPCASGWRGVLEKFESEYITQLKRFPRGYVVLLVDFDGDYPRRRQLFGESVPPDLRDRAFVVGARENPERLRQELAMDFEAIGYAIADDCYKMTKVVWSHAQLAHNEPDRDRMEQSVRSILFGA